MRAVGCKTTPRRFVEKSFAFKRRYYNISNEMNENDKLA